ncbi:nucleoside triphosphate pyrophosphohydrolase [Croceimicrobium hydrocarbonivorans]|uniref:Nucleoside triphosphate pyrophosphohydrolase n=1 Tax=Croceimicrobium hydrocarbonivorans TaxID=2761580 RepID=A0A7H0VG12_9FLAO|nr:nucleoside triphosphate pyrophosphohydrolase [Croceimicrobium hydrocarbonivorans]QNR24660.1 nucleoside triphosphate pyrophosphohydrolase [Croceimicrobium hydrocarbonivorans]
MKHSRQERLEAFGRLLDIMDDLREKCPWDRKQTMESLRHLTIEEVYELGDAILDEDLPEVKKELGDLLLHMVFYAKIGEEKQSFDIADVLNSICEKLIHRHPHIYGDVEANDEETVKANWEKLKLKEGKKSVLEGVPRSLPALVKATRIQDKARGAGFDWEETQQVWAKLREEISELEAEVEAADPEKIEAEFGDVLFSLINISRFIKVDPESALERTNKKFIRRFQYLEEATKAKGLQLDEMSLEEMDRYWEEAKAKGL